jgi:hypothetical protein
MSTTWTQADALLHGGEEEAVGMPAALVSGKQPEASHT